MESCWRVSVVRGARVTDERVVPWGQAVVLAGEARIAMERGRPVLRVPPGLAAEVATRGTPRAPVTGAAVLDERTRGYVDLPTGRVIFQAMPKPAPLPRPRSSLRPGTLRAVDWPFLGMLGAVLLLAASGIARVARHHPLSLARWDAPAASPADVPVFHIPRPLPVTPPPAAPRQATRPARPRGTASPERPPRATSDAVGRAGLLPLLGPHAQGVVGTVFAPSGLDPTILETLGEVKNVDPVLVASPPRSKTIGAPGVQGITVAGPVGGPVVDLDDEVTCPDGSRARNGACPIRFEPDEFPPPPTDVPSDVFALIAREVKGRLGAVQGCYERALKLHGRQNGRLDLRLVVSPDGRVAEANAEPSLFAAGGDEIATCVRRKATTWTFSTRPATDVTVEFPFVLSTP